MNNQQIAEALRAKFKIKGLVNDNELLRRFIPADISESELSLIKDRSRSIDELLRAIQIYFESK